MIHLLSLLRISGSLFHTIFTIVLKFRARGSKKYRRLLSHSHKEQWHRQNFISHNPFVKNLPTTIKHNSLLHIVCYIILFFPKIFESRARQFSHGVLISAGFVNQTKLILYMEESLSKLITFLDDFADAKFWKFDMSQAEREEKTTSHCRSSTVRKPNHLQELNAEVFDCNHSALKSSMRQGQVLSRPSLPQPRR